jgi:dihydrodipicolinate synthase/N-acetylneuraminate lyase
MMDACLRVGFREHVDGTYAIAPRWTADIVRAAQALDWDAAAVCQRRLNALQDLFGRYGVFPAMTAMLNARGIPGSFCPGFQSRGSVTSVQNLIPSRGRVT